MVTVREQARQDAAEFLRENWNGTIPVDPFKIAESLDLDLQVTSLKPGVSGAIVADGNRTTILVERSNSYERKAFTCAHELGHYVDRSKRNDAEYSFVDLRTDQKSYDAHEIYANEFAANLLMPPAEFMESVRTYGSDYAVAAEFAVSPAAVRTRRARLGLGTNG